MRKGVVILILALFIVGSAFSDGLVFKIAGPGLSPAQYEITINHIQDHYDLAGRWYYRGTISEGDVETFGSGSVSGQGVARVNLTGNSDIRLHDDLLYVDIWSEDHSVKLLSWQQQLIQDNTPPAVSSVGASDLWQAEDITLLPTALDNAGGVGVDPGSWQYSVDGGESWVSGYPISIDQEGVTTILIRARDFLGNQGVTSVVTRLDKSAPAINVEQSAADAAISPQGTWGSGTTVTVRALASDGNGVGVDKSSWRYRLFSGTGDSLTGWLSGAVTQVLNPGETVVAFEVRDLAGHIANASIVVSIAGASGTSSAPPSYKLPANDAWTPGISGGFSKQGAAGLVGSRNNSLSLATTSTISPAVQTSSTGPTVIGYVSLMLENQTIAVAQSPLEEVSRAAITAGNDYVVDTGATVRFTAKDRINLGAGFKVKKGAVFSARVDPAMSGEWLRDERFKVRVQGYAASGIADWEAAKNPGTSDWTQVDSALWFDVSLTKTVGGFNQGENIVIFKLTDNVGNVGAAVVTLKYDTLPPALEGVPVGWTNGTISPIATDGGSGIDPATLKYSVGGTNYVGFTSGAAISVASETGTCDVYFKVRDRAGNGATLVKSVKVDKTDPVITVTSEQKDGELLVTAEAVDDDSGVDGSTWSYSVDGGKQTGSGSSVTITEPGAHTVTFSVKDHVGNTDEKGPVDVLLDDQAPGITFDPETITAWQNVGQTVVKASAADDGEGGGTGVDQSSWQYQIEDADSGSVQTPWTNLTADSNGQVQVTVSREGRTRVSLRVKDTAGNVGEGSLVVRLDHTAPEITAFTFTDQEGTILGTEGTVVANLWSNSASITVTAAATDAGSGLFKIEWWNPDQNSWQGGQAETTAEGITTLYFRATDSVGNSSESECKVRLDRTPPVLNPGSLQDNYVRGPLVFATASAPSATDSLSTIDSKGIQYRFDAGAWNSLSGDSLDISGLTDGSHTLYLQVADKAGNSTQDKGGLKFTKDTTPPKVEDVKVYTSQDLAQEIKTGEYSGENSVYVTVEDDGSGELSGYKWGRYATVQTDPVLDQYTEQGADFIVSGLLPGANYLYVKILDRAGNESVAVHEKTILVDNATPQAPVIKSSSHTRAFRPEDAVALNNALFRFFPQDTGPSGLGGFDYSLRVGLSKDTAMELESGSVGAEGVLELDGLADNQPDEFYYLFAWVVSGNGKRSLQAAVYPFRVDSTPPKNLTISSSTHSNPDAYYTSTRATFSWDKPADFTGIKSYYFKASTSKILPEPLPADYDPTAQWQATKAEELTLNLKTVTGGEASGKVYFAVCAEDYAGNLQFDETYARYDTEKPVIPGDITISPDNRTVYASWQQPTDNLGVAGVYVSLARVEGQTLIPLGNPVFIQPTAAQEHTFIGVDPDLSITYAVRLTAVDQAGNETTRLTGFSFSGEHVIIDIAVPYVSHIQGFKVWGSYSTTLANSTGNLDLPASFGFQVGGASEASVALADLTFESGEFQSGANPTVAYTVSLNGYEFAGQGISISSAGGLVFNQLTFTTPVASGGSKSFTYPNVAVTAPPQVLFGGVETTEAVPFGLDSLFIGEAGGQPEAAWQFRAVAATALGGANWHLKGGYLELTEIKDKVTAYTLDGNQNQVYHISLADTAITPERETASAEISESFFLKAAGNLFAVDRARLLKDRLFIEHSTLILPSGFTTDTVEVENFSVDLSGQTREEAGFSITPFSFVSNGISYRAQSIRLIDGYLVITSGTLDPAGVALGFEDMVITSQGPSYELPVTVSPIERSFHGFLVTSLNPRLVEAGLYLADARIQLPLSFGGGKRPLSGLVVSPVDNAIVAPGVGTESFALATGYGDGVTVAELTLNNAGLFATRLSVALPPFIQAAQTSITLNNLPLYADGSVGTGTTAVKLPFELAGFSLAGRELRFDGSRLIFGTVAASLTSDYYPQQLEFWDLGVSATSVVTEGICPDEVSLYKDGWSFSLGQLSLGLSGIHGQAELYLNADFGGRTLSFEQFKIYPDGSFESGEAVGDLYLRIHGWKVYAQRVSLSGNKLTIPLGEISLYSTMGYGKLAIPDIVLDSEGKVAGCGQGTDLVGFLSENGFQVETNGYSFTDSGLYLSGQVYFPAALGENVAASYDSTIRLEADGSVITPQQAGPIIYHVAGWDVRGENYRFDRQGLFVGKSTVTFLGFEIPIPQMRFYADGHIKVAGHGFQGFTLKPFQGPVELGVTDLVLSEDGLNVKAFISFPLPGMESPTSFYFDKLTFHPDGRVTTDLAIAEHSFELQGFKFLFRNIRFDETGFFIGEGIITLPQGALEGRQLRLINFRVTQNGDFELGGLNVDPFELWGYTFYLDNLSFAQGELSVQGGIRLPNEFFIPTLSGRRINIDRFVVDLPSKSVKEFAASVQGEFSFKLYDKWEVVVDTISIDKQLLKIDKGKLLLPPEFNLESVEVRDIVIDVLKPEVSVGGITLNNAHLNFGGLDFIMDSLNIDETSGLLFAGRVTVPDAPDKFPEAIAGRTLVVEEFQIKPDYTVGNISASVAGINTPLFDGMFFLSGGSLGFAKHGSEFFLSCAGSLIFGDRFPDGIKGKTVVIEAFEMELSTGEVKAFSAGAAGLNFDLFGAAFMENAGFLVSKNQISGEYELDVSGDFVLTGSFFPAVLKNRRVTVERFKVDSTGAIAEFAAHLDLPGKRALFSDVWLNEARVEAALNGSKTAVVFGITGQVLFGQGFPQGIAGSVVTISSLEFDTQGRLSDLDIGADFGDVKLFDSMAVNNAFVRISKYSDTDVLISVSGQVVLPAGFPEGLAGLVLDVKQFSITSSGTLVALNVQADNLNVPLWGQVLFSNGAISVVKGGAGEVIFSVSGNLKLPASMGQGFSGLTLGISKLKVSSTRGLLEFSAGVSSYFEFELFAGIKTGFRKLNLSKDGVQMAGNIQFPPGFFGLDDFVVGLENLELGWDGRIRAITAGIEHVVLDLEGFKLEVTNLMFRSAGISMEKALFLPPANMELPAVGIRDAAIDTSGHFHGEFIIPKLELEFAGFGVILYDPQFRLEQREISFSKVTAKLPEFVGGYEITLPGVKVSPQGIAFTGGPLELPNFDIAGGLGFRDIKVEFSTDSSTGGYYVAGGGKAIIPGAGTFGAAVSFVDQSSLYPIGIKRALFSYEMYGLGLPLGTTGLYLNQIRGGIAFGPPDEIPARIRGMFDNGIRLQLGLTLVDQTGGAGLRGDIDMWLDITDWDWAFQGRVTVLSGVAHGELLAALTGRGFYGYFGFSLTFVRGHVEVYIFQMGGRTRVNGAGRVQFGITRGSIAHWSFRIWPFPRVHIYIPPWTLWLPSLGAEFGTFRNGAEGFKGYANLPILGQVGLFLPRGGGIRFSNLSSYVLYMPYEGLNLSQDMAPSLSATPAPGQGPRVFSLDRMPEHSGKDTYYFDVPAAGGNGSGSLKKGSGLRPSLSLQGGLQQAAQDEPAERVERLVFAIGYAEGDPQVTAVSPSGARYTLGDKDVIHLRTDWGMMMGVLNPEPGQWTMEVTDVISRDAYHIEVLGKTAVPEISLASPAYAGLHVEESFEVTGQAATPSGEPAQVAIYLSRNKGVYTGTPVAEVTADAQGNFSVAVSTSGLASGQYYVYGAVKENDDDPEVKAFAPGSVQVDNYRQPLLPVENLIVGERGSEGLSIAFSDPNGQRIQGFKLYVENLTQGTEETILLGYVTSTVIPGFTQGDKLRLKVAGYDDHKREGPLSEPVTVVKGGEQQTINSFTLENPTFDLALKVGQQYAGSIKLTAPGAVKTGSAYDFAGVEVVELPVAEQTDPEGNYTQAVNLIHLSFDQALWDLTGGGATIGYTLTPDLQLTPGQYLVKLLVYNQGNRALSQELNITVTVSYPQVALNLVAPDSFHTADGAELTLVGDNFLEGSRVFLDDTELVLTETELTELKATVPPGVAGGAHNVVVEGPGGQRAQLAVEVLAPDYVVLGLKTQTQAQAGARAVFNFTIRGENRFAEAVAFYLEELPAGWNGWLDRPAITPDQVATVTVELPVDAALGTYTLKAQDQRGESLNLDVMVTESYPAPFISSLSAYTGFTGDELTIYGYGFGDSGTVKIGELAMELLSYSRDAVTVLIPPGAVTAGITVARDGLTSAPKTFYVKNAGFRLYARQETLRMQPGETRTVTITVSGYAAGVDLEATAEESNLAVSLDQTYVVPNGQVALTVALDAGIANGSYPVLITGREGQLTATATIQVKVGDAFAFTTTKLPSGMEGVDYTALLKTENGAGAARFELSAGSLPVGLVLEEDGQIHGRPQELGTKRFTVKAQDEEERAIAAEFSITIEENAWAQDAKDGGQSRFNPVPSPADARKLWESQSFTGARAILTGHKRVYLLTDSQVVGLESESGYKIWGYSGRFESWAYAAGTLFVLDENHTFKALDGGVGGLKWQREGVDAFSTEGNLLLLSGQGGIQKVEAATGALLGVIQAELDPEARYVWQNGLLYQAAGNTLSALQEAGWQEVFTTEPGTVITTLSADEKGIFLLTDRGRLVVLDENLQVAGERYLPVTEARLALGQSRLVVAASDQVAVLSRTSLKELYSITTNGEPALAAEKLFIAASDGLWALNGYDGSVIWSGDGAQLDLALAGERLYGLSEKGEVSCYFGPDNLYPPSTTFVLFPETPDGEQGYYITTPLLKLKAHDPESYVAGTFYKESGQADYTTYTGALDLKEGQYSLLAYSVDNHGYREPDRLQSFQVDITDPVSTLKTQGEISSTGYYLTAVTLTLTATDNLSGLDRIEYRLNESGWTTYTGAITLGDEGPYQFSYRSKDVAGNYETAREKSYFVDLYDPQIFFDTYSSPGVGVVYLKGFDSGSGIARLEYQVDQGAVQNYLDPVAITEPGSHRVRFRAVDKAARSSAWQSVDLEVAKKPQGDVIKNLRFSYRARGRKVIKDVQPGQALYWPNKGRWNRVESLPDYLVGTDFIRLNIKDRRARGSAFIRFEAGEDITVFIMKHQRSRADLSGWNLVEEAFPVQPRLYFKGGADIYSRAFKKGEQVAIPGSNSRGGFANLVFVRDDSKEFIKITGPKPGSELYASDVVRYAAVVLSSKPFTREWSARFDQGEWQLLGTDPSGELALPYVEDESEVSLRLEVKDQAGEVFLEDQETYSLVNKAQVLLTNPGPGCELLVNQWEPLEFAAQGIRGAPYAADEVEWQLKEEEGSWIPVRADDGLFLDRPGDYTLKAVLDLAGHTKEFKFLLKAVEAYSTTGLNFGTDEDQGLLISLGEVLGLTESGRLFGFNTDHTERQGSFIAVHLPERPQGEDSGEERGKSRSARKSQGKKDSDQEFEEEKGLEKLEKCRSRKDLTKWLKKYNKKKRGATFKQESYIALADAGEFISYVGNGRFQVTLLVGPVKRRELLHLQVNNKLIDIQGQRHRSGIFRVTLEVEAEQGRLVIKGTENLPLMELDIKELTPEEPLTATQVEALKRIIVLPRFREHQREKQQSRRSGGRR